MASKARSIEAADHDMGMHFWPLSLQGNVAGEGEHLACSSMPNLQYSRFVTSK
jgi:hypothetical protein